MAEIQEKDQENFQKLDDNAKEIKKKAESNILTETQIKQLIEENKDRFDFNKIIESIQLKMDKFVVFTDGKEQLVYEDGEFFVESVLEPSQPRKKKKRTEARDMYLEYFIKYQINPFIKQKEMNSMIKQIYKSQNIDVKKEMLDEEREIKIDKDSSEQDLKDKLKELKQKEENIKKNMKPKVKTVKKSKEKNNIQDISQ